MKPKLFWIGVALLLIGLIGLSIALIYFDEIKSKELIIDFFEKYLSPDNSIVCPLCVILRIRKFIFSLGMVWLVLYFSKYSNGLKIFYIRKQNFIIGLAYTCTFVLIILSIIINDEDSMPEISFFELFTAILLLCSALISGALAIYTKKLNRGVLILLTVIFLILFGEEISWGQSIFNWKTPDLFSQINFQNETNIHNILDVHISIFLYVIVNLLLGYFFLSLERIKSFFSKYSWGEKIAPFYPSNEYTLFGFIFLYLSIQIFNFWDSGELTEQIISVLCAVYSIDILMKNRQKYI